MQRREFLKLAGLVAATTAATSCTPVYRMLAGAGRAAPWIEGDGATFAFLNRLTYGPTMEERRHVAAVGTEAWIEEQLAPPAGPDLPAEIAVRPLTSLTLEAADLAVWERADVMAELKTSALLRRVYAGRQLMEVMTEFWTDHFNISVEKGACWYLKTIDDRDVIRRHALGNFGELLLASARSPAMLVYLDNQANDRRSPNENYARELLELHTLGIDGGYTQRDVMELARCLTGWTVRQRFWLGQFEFQPEKHDPGAKVVLGMPVAAAGGHEAEAILEQLAVHPSTARHLARKLARRFLALEPDEESDIVARAARAFLASKGEIRPVLKTILLDGLARHPSQPTPKFKRPVHLVVSALRMLNAATDGGRGLHQHLARMGQPLFEWPTPDGPPDETAAWQTGLMARWEFACQLAGNRIPGTLIDLPAILQTTGAESPDGWIDALSNAALGKPLAEPGRTEVWRALSAVDEDEGPSLLLAALLASPAFQWH
jgi:uncharacterized protein (DUF1800 family)